MKKKPQKTKKENKQIVEVHIYVHQMPSAQSWPSNPDPMFPNYWPNRNIFYG